ncbi:ion channel [uncultured Psychrosphaera sp.]|uniref:ion channel n=1 Tax=uncultured Psychrosphaera sp. TaxID=1403522 RepID=UPI0030F93865
MSDQNTCKYHNLEGKRCEEKDMGAGHCFWHDKTIDKTGMDLSERLENYAKSGGMLQGLQLKQANLKDIRLVRRGCSSGYDMRNCDLYRADMENAHLFNINLEGSSLMKTRLNDSKLNCANLHNTNLLGVKLQNARIDNIKVGEYVQQEAIAIQADKDKDRTKAIDYYEQSEEIYRNLRKTAETDGIHVLAGHFAHKELIMRRKQHPQYSQKRVVSKAVDLFCGYGEKPINVILFSLILILFCAVLYFILGIKSDTGIIQLSFNNSFVENLYNFFSSIYFSVVTFTTLGYGDINPVGYSRLVATIEAFIGSFALALFVVVFVQKTTR